MRRSSVKVLLATVAMAVVALAILSVDVSAAEQETAEIFLPSQGAAEGSAATIGFGGKPPCCDTCKCTRSMPPKCQCMDKKDFRCHQSCQDCVELPIKIWPPKFVCHDTFEGYCGKPCTNE